MNNMPTKSELAYAAWADATTAAIYAAAAELGWEACDNPRAASRYISLQKLSGEIDDDGLPIYEDSTDVRLSDHACRYGGCELCLFFDADTGVGDDISAVIARLKT